MIFILSDICCTWYFHWLIPPCCLSSLSENTLLFLKWNYHLAFLTESLNLLIEIFRKEWYIKEEQYLCLGSSSFITVLMLGLEKRKHWNTITRMSIKSGLMAFTAHCPSGKEDRWLHSAPPQSAWLGKEGWFFNWSPVSACQPLSVP